MKELAKIVAIDYEKHDEHDGDEATYLFKYELLVKSPCKSKSISSDQPSRAKPKKSRKTIEGNQRKKS